MRIKRIVFVNRAPFDKLDLDLSDKHVISLTGINGSGKTTIISHIVDAFYEIARDSFRIEFTGNKEGKLYRISSSLYN
jgi:predicted ATP-binding protein involved in virulence